MGSLFSPLQRSKSEYLRVNLGESNTGTSFPVHQPPQPGLALDDAVRHSHLAAQSRQENHELKRERVCVCVCAVSLPGHGGVLQLAWAVAIAQC